MSTKSELSAEGYTLGSVTFIHGTVYLECGYEKLIHYMKYISKLLHLETCITLPRQYNDVMFTVLHYVTNFCYSLLDFSMMHKYLNTSCDTDGQHQFKILKVIARGNNALVFSVF
jgi:hypothetical protein